MDEGLLPSEPGPARRPRRTWCRPDLFAVALCIAIGLLLSVLPHIIMWPRFHNPTWIADYDDLELYLPAASQSYFGHLTHLTDVVWNRGFSIYPSLSFLPSVWASRLFHLGPQGIGLLWRVWAGITIPSTFYLLVRRFVKSPPHAAALVVLLITDAGLILCQPLVTNIAYTVAIASGHPGHLLEANPFLQPQWRIITPGLSLGYLIWFIYAVSRASNRGLDRWTIVAGISLGLLFWIYLYYWTTALLALAISVVLDVGARRKYLWISTIGIVLGAPSLLIHWTIKRNTAHDWLWRSDCFLPIPHFSELQIPKTSIFFAVLLLAWTLWRRRELIFIAATAVAALFLLNEQIVTGLQIQNFHWKYASGPVLVLLLYLVLWPLISGSLMNRRAARVGLWSVVIVHATAAFYLRYVETVQSADSVAIMGAFEQFRGQRLAGSHTPLVAGSVLAGERHFVSMAVVFDQQLPLDGYAVQMSPYVTDQEWRQRIAFNAYLSGIGRDEFRAREREAMAVRSWGPWSRDPVQAKEALDDLFACYDVCDANRTELLDRFSVRYVSLPAKQTPPKYLAHGWREVQSGPHWQIWQRQND